MKIKRITAILTAIFMLLISMTVSADNISRGPDLKILSGVFAI